MHPNSKTPALLAGLLFLASANVGLAQSVDPVLPDETVPPSNEVQNPIPRQPNIKIELPPQNQAPLSNTNAELEPVSQNPNVLRPSGSGTQQGNQRPKTSTIPIVGATKLLKSLEELDRPMSPEEITAYGAAIQSQFPMTPEMILDFRKRLDKQRQAAATPTSGQFPNILNDSTTISLDAYEDPEVILTGIGTASVVSFFDKNGEAWPIASFVIGKPASFQVYALQQGSNQLAISQLVHHGFSNIIVSLVGEHRPLTFELRTNALNTHYRRDFRVNGIGPNTKPKPIKAKVDKKAPVRASDNVMMAFVTGADIPSNAVRLNTDDRSVKAWKYNGAIYLRSENTIISPPASKILTGPGQVKAFKIRPTSVALVSVNGSVSKVRIEQ